MELWVYKTLYFFKKYQLEGNMVTSATSDSVDAGHHVLLSVLCCLLESIQT